MLIGFADAIETAQAKGGDLQHMTGFASKAAEQATRIAGVLALWQDLSAPSISPEDMTNGIDMAEFYLGEAKRLSDAATISVEIERAEKLRIWLIETWSHPEILPREVVRHAPIRAFRESPAAKSALAMLERHDWLFRLPEGAEVRGATRKEAFQIMGARHVV